VFGNTDVQPTGIDSKQQLIAIDALHGQRQRFINITALPF
jgi:hypothetical protein